MYYTFLAEVGVEICAKRSKSQNRWKGFVGHCISAPKLGRDQRLCLSLVSHFNLILLATCGCTTIQIKYTE